MKMKLEQRFLSYMPGVHRPAVSLAPFSVFDPGDKPSADRHPYTYVLNRTHLTS